MPHTTVDLDSTDGSAGPISVVIPARNAAMTIELQLAALASQDYPGVQEVVVVDNGSQDKTAEVAMSWRDRVPGLRVVEARERHSVAHARNVGFSVAAHDLVLVCDADDVVDHSWASRMVEALAHFDVVGGGMVQWDGGALPVGSASSVGGAGFGFLPTFSGCNFGMRRSVWAAVGKFDEMNLSCEDIDFSWRAQLAGFSYSPCPEAFVYYRVVSDSRSVFRKWMHYGMFQPALYAKFRRSGLRRRPVHRAVARWAVLIATSYRLLGSSSHARTAWCAQAGRCAGRVVGSVRFRALFL